MRARLWLVAFLVAGVLTACVGVVLAVLPRCRYSNCMFYAWERYWRDGCAVVMVPSKYTPIMHWFSVDDLPVGLVGDEYAPIAAKRHRVFPPLVFKGRVQPWEP